LRSLSAPDGGLPGPGLIPCGPGYPAPPDIFAVSAYGQFMARTANMLVALAARSDAQERRIAALEKTVAVRETATNQIATALARGGAGIYRTAAINRRVGPLSTPRRAFKMGSINGRKRSESGRSAQGKYASCGRSTELSALGRIRPNLQQDYATLSS
jgi:hypothetical protein